MSVSLVTTKEDSLFVVAVGTAFNGITLYGPFDNFEDALDFFNDSLSKTGVNAEIITLTQPNPF